MHVCARACTRTHTHTQYCLPSFGFLNPIPQPGLSTSPCIQLVQKGPILSLTPGPVPSVSLHGDSLLD
jgi:hypothetical protein